MRTTRTLMLAMLACAAASSATAQEANRLKILRIWPGDANVHPLESLVITFDHPVAPKLEQSIDPARVVRFTPAAPSRIFWQDPSTIAVEFNRPWPFGSHYDIEIDPELRSATGLPLAAGQGRRMWVRPARLIGMLATERFGQPSTEQQALGVYESPVSLAKLAGRAWILPTGDCPLRAPVALTPDSIRPISRDDMPRIREARGDKRDTRLDTLRRVVRFTATRALPRGCEARLRLPAYEEGKETAEVLLRTPVAFKVDSILLSASAPEIARVVVRFSMPVTERQLRAGVRIDGRPPLGFQRYGDTTDPRLQWVLLDSVRPGRHADVTVSAELRNAVDEPLGTSVERRIVAPHLPPDVTFAAGQVLVPKDAGALLVVRHVNTDSVTIVIGRVSPAKRARALDHAGWYAWRMWSEIRGDTVVRTIASPAPVDSAATYVIPASIIPPDWRGDPVLLVRAMPAAQPSRTIVNGAIRVVARRTDPWGTPFAVLQRSDIAAHAQSFHGKTDVWVTALRSADPVAAAAVRVLNEKDEVLAVGTTDARGRVRLDYGDIPRGSDTAAVLEITSGSNRLLLGLPEDGASEDTDGDERGYAWYGEGPSAGAGGVLLHGAAFSERGVYRPGERVYLKGLARRAVPYGTFTTPAGDSARWSIFRLNERYESERVSRRLTTLTRFGTSADSFDIPRGAPLGRYQALLALRDARGWRTAAHAEFSVAEYRPAEFNLALHADTTIARFSGDTVRVQADANYLFGMPMAGATVQWSTRVSEAQYWEARIPGLDGFTVGRAWWRLPESERAIPHVTAPDSGVLDARGVRNIALPVGRVTHLGRMVIAVAATDANRQVVTAEQTITVHAADAYVGIRSATQRWVHDVRDSIALHLLAVHADGRRRIGTPIRIIAQRYDYRESRPRIDTVWRSELRSADEPVRAVFRAPAPGWYELLATVRDEAGRESTTGYDVWVTGQLASGARASTGRLEIRPDRESYAPGDVATIVVTSPVEQRAWITLSHSVPLGEQQVQLHVGPNVVRVPIPMEAIPRADLRVIGVAPLGKGLGERSSYFTVESRVIDVSAKPRQLDVRVSTDRKSYTPGDEVRVGVKITDAAGKGRRAEATVWAVDEGVGLLTAFARPDVLTALLGTGFVSPWNGSSLLATVLGLTSGLLPTDAARIRIRGMSSYTSSRSMALESVVVVGYGTQAANAPLRQRFATTPFFAGAIETDSLGVAKVKFKLPDNVTTYRVYATAVTEGTEAGSGDTTLVSTRPLIVRAALPRIVRLGDTLLAGGVMTHDTDEATPVSLRVETTGMAVSGPTTKLDTLRGRKSAELRFPMRVVSGDSVSVTLRGGSSRDGDAVKVSLPVSPAGHARAHVVTGTLEGRVDLTLPTVEGIDANRSRVTVQLGTSLLPLVRQSSEALRVYPYLCTEQLSSAGRALLARVVLEHAIDPKAVMSDRDRGQLEKAVSLILARQQSEGGFGYWSRDGWTTPWLTAYALDLLMRAREAGIDVPVPATRRAADYLKGSVARGGAFDWWHTRDSSAYRHDALAVARTLRRLGTPDTTLEQVVTGFRGAIPFVDRLDLAMLRAARGDSAEARELVNGAWNAARLSGKKVELHDSTAGQGWLFESRVRPMARLLEATATLEPRHPLLGALLETLVQRRSGERHWWWNTLDESAAADAIVAVRSALHAGGPRGVTVSGPSGTLARASFEPLRGDSIAMPLASLLPGRRAEAAPHLTMVADATAPIYYAATIFEVPRARPVRADDEGISVERWYEPYEGAGKPIVSAREGQLVRVRLRITVPSTRDFVAVEDPLPAGLEAIDLSLRTSSTLAPFAGAPKQPRNSGDMPEGRWRYGTWDGGWWSPWEHKEIRDDRVLYFARQLWKGTFEASYVARATTVGTFVRPPAHAEEMYNPAVHGRSDGGVFTIVAREGR